MESNYIVTLVVALIGAIATILASILSGKKKIVHKNTHTQKTVIIKSNAKARFKWLKKAVNYDKITTSERKETKPTNRANFLFISSFLSFFITLYTLDLNKEPLRLYIFLAFISVITLVSAITLYARKQLREPLVVKHKHAWITNVSNVMENVWDSSKKCYKRQISKLEVHLKYENGEFAIFYLPKNTYITENLTGIAFISEFNKLVGFHYVIKENKKQFILKRCF